MFLSCMKKQEPGLFTPIHMAFNALKSKEYLSEQKKSDFLKLKKDSKSID